jgi:hypothetical protein
MPGGDRSRLPGAEAGLLELVDQRAGVGQLRMPLLDCSRSKGRLKNCGPATIVTRKTTPPGAIRSAIPQRKPTRPAIGQ